MEALWRDQHTLAREVAHDVLRLQEAMTGKHFDCDNMITRMVDAFNGDPARKCMGRSAPARLERALDEVARLLDLTLPTVRRIAPHTNANA